MIKIVFKIYKSHFFKSKQDVPSVVLGHIFYYYSISLLQHELVVVVYIC